MRTIIGTARVSLDGVMQGPGGPQEDTRDGFDLGGWSMNYADDRSWNLTMDLVGTRAKPNDLLLGRKTYEIFAGYWPHVADDHPIGPVFTKANKYVMTSGVPGFAWDNTYALRDIDAVKEMKAGDGADIVIWGSSTIYPHLLEADLIDRLVLLTCPIVLGKGRKLFGSTTRPVSLKLTASDVSSTGVIIATYERAD
jgi:dihydrofolate reductase